MQPMLFFRGERVWFNMRGTDSRAHGTLPPAEGRSYARLLLSDRGVAATLLLHLRAHWPRLFPNRQTAQDALQTFVTLVSRGDIVVGRDRRNTLVTLLTPPPEEEPVREDPGPEDDWVEIKLINEDGEPVPEVRYELVVPDGTIHTGTLDADGCASVQGIRRGSCLVSFPDLLPDEWRPVL